MEQRGKVVVTVGKRGAAPVGGQRQNPPHLAPEVPDLDMPQWIFHGGSGSGLHSPFPISFFLVYLCRCAEAGHNLFFIESISVTFIFG
jgi:hypothetical protein